MSTIRTAAILTAALLADIFDRRPGRRAREIQRRGHAQGRDRVGAGADRRRTSRRDHRAPHARQRGNRQLSLWRSDVHRAGRGSVRRDRHRDRPAQPAARRSPGECAPGRILARRQTAGGHRRVGWHEDDGSRGLGDGRPGHRSAVGRGGEEHQPHRGQLESRLDAGWISRRRVHADAGAGAGGGREVQGADRGADRRPVVEESVSRLGCALPREPVAQRRRDRRRDRRGHGTHPGAEALELSADARSGHARHAGGRDREDGLRRHRRHGESDPRVEPRRDAAEDDPSSEGREGPRDPVDGRRPHVCVCEAGRGVRAQPRCDGGEEPDAEAETRGRRQARRRGHAGSEARHHAGRKEGNRDGRVVFRRRVQPRRVQAHRDEQQGLVRRQRGRRHAEADSHARQGRGEESAGERARLGAGWLGDLCELGRPRQVGARHRPHRRRRRVK